MKSKITYIGEPRKYVPNSNYPAEVSVVKVWEGTYRAKQWASSKKGYHVVYEGCSYKFFFWLDNKMRLFAVEESTDKGVLNNWDLDSWYISEEKTLINAVMRQVSCLNATDEKVKEALDATPEPTPLRPCSKRESRMERHYT